jgi:hypothetical protein
MNFADSKRKQIFCHSSDERGGCVMLKKALFRLGMLMMIVLAPCQSAHAANFNIYFHFNTFDGIAVGEIYREDQVAFRLRIAKDGIVPVISMQKGNVDTVIVPDIANGMFMLRITGTGDQ